MNDENKTIADLLKSIDDKTVDRAEVMPLLQSIERNTIANSGKVIATAVGTAITKAMEKTGGGKKVAPEPAKAIAIPGVVAPEPAKAKVTSKAASVAPVVAAVAKVAAVAGTVPVKKTVYAAQPTTTPAVVARDVSGKFTSKTTGTDGVAEQKQDNQTDKLSSILKDAVGSKKETIKDTAGRMAMGPFYDIGKELLEATGSMRDNANDEKSTVGRLKNWGQAKIGIKHGKAEAAHDKAQAKHDKVEAASDKAEAKHDQLQAKADKAKQGAKVATATGTAIMGGGGGEGGGGILSTLAGTWLGGKASGVLGKVATKIPMLGKLFPSLAAGGAAAGVAGSVAAGAAPAVAGAGGGMFSGMMAKAGGLASKIPGAGMLGKIGGRIPLLGGLIAGGVTLAQGGSKSEAVGSGVGTTAGAVAGGALGSLLGPVGTVAGAALGGIAGDWIGTKLGGLFNNQNKADADKVKQQQDLLKAQDESQKGFWDKLTGSSNPLLAGIGKIGDSLSNGASAAGSAYSNSRAKGGGFFSSMVEGAKGAYQGVSGKTKERESMLSQAATSAGITDPKEKAAFMGQMNHESAGFTAMKEGNYSPDAVWKLRGGQLAKQGISKEQVSAAYASGGSGAMDEMMYGGRMGNTQKGDATKFKGRGFVQLTGKDNYADMTKRLQAEGENVDLLKNPEMAEDPRIAAKISTLFWKKSGAGAAARNGDQAGVDQAINGGTRGNANGKEDRAAKTQYYANKLAKEGGASPAAPLAPGTPEFAAKQAEMQAKFVADQQGTAPVVAAATPGTGSPKGKGKKGKGKGKVISPPVVVAKKEELKPTEAVKPEDKTDIAKAEELTAEGQKATSTTAPAVTAEPKILTAREAREKRNKATADAARGDVATQQGEARKAYAKAKTPKEKAAILEKLQTGQTAAQDKAIVDMQNPALAVTSGTPAEVPTQTVVAAAQGAVAAPQADKPRLAKRSSQGVQSLSPLPQPQPVQLPPPPPVEVPGLERLAKSQEQQAEKKPDVVASASKGIPNIKTEFDDTMLVLMSYDRI